MVTCSIIEVVRPVRGWEENKYIATSPYTPLFAIRCPVEGICNVFEGRMNLKFDHLNPLWIRSWVRYGG